MPNYIPGYISQDVSALGQIPIRDRSATFLVPIANVERSCSRCNTEGAADCRSRIDFHPSEKTETSRTSLRLRSEPCLYAAAAFRTFAAGFGTVFHTVQLIAAFRAGIANLGTYRADLLAELRIA